MNFVLQMANHSRSTVTFTWQPCNEKHILEVEPPFGELGKNLNLFILFYTFLETMSLQMFE